ncbi:MAG: hypothetical protein PHY82_00340 [Lentisphaeria bacterium]|nr:hypothetical protein [Lentisphaeria bacterium]
MEQKNRDRRMHIFKQASPQNPTFKKISKVLLLSIKPLLPFSTCEKKKGTAVIPQMMERGFSFLTTKSTKQPEKISWEVALTAVMRCSSHEIFSGRFVFFVVKKCHCHIIRRNATCRLRGRVK